MNTLIMPVGLPRCGKSTFTKRYMAEYPGVAIVNPDSIRAALHGQAFIQEAEDFIWANVKLTISALMLAGQTNIILDATNLNAFQRAEWVKLAKKHNYKVLFVMFRASKEVCQDRAKLNDQDYLIPVIDRMSKYLVDVSDDEISRYKHFPYIHVVEEGEIEWK